MYRTFSTDKVIKKSQNSRNQRFSYNFYWMMRVSGSVPLTNVSGSGRPKNLRIRIRTPVRRGILLTDGLLEVLKDELSLGLVRLDLGGQEVRVELLHMRQGKVRAENIFNRSKGTSVLPIYHRQ
jgi:hypothetical protein